MTSTHVRAAQLEDVPHLVALMAEFYDEAGFTLLTEPAAHTFTQLIGDPRLRRAWILEHELVPVGYVVLTVAFSMEYGGVRGFVDDFFVRRA